MSLKVQNCIYQNARERPSEMRKLRHPGAVMGLFALGLEATGVASGAYVYGDFPIKILEVPLCIPIMWVLVMALARAQKLCN